MIQKIVSFGFRHGMSSLYHPGELVIDVRPLFTRNPYHNRKLRELRGTDPEVQADILKTPNFTLSYDALKQRVLAGTGDYVVYLGCTGGHHRSVFLAHTLGKELGVPVEHRDFHKK